MRAWSERGGMPNLPGGEQATADGKTPGGRSARVAPPFLRHKTRGPCVGSEGLTRPVARLASLSLDQTALRRIGRPHTACRRTGRLRAGRRAKDELDARLRSVESDLASKAADLAHEQEKTRELTARQAEMVHKNDFEAVKVTGLGAAKQGPPCAYSSMMRCLQVPGVSAVTFCILAACWAWE